MDPLKTPRRIAFAGDWHANHRWAQKAVAYSASEGADVIVHLGDFGYHFFRRHFLDPVTRELELANLILLFVDGNHENFDTLYRYPVDDETGLRKITDRIWHLPRGFRWEWGGVRFLALGGAHSIDRKFRIPGSSWWYQETITDADVDVACTGGEVDVMVTHDCPAGVDIPGIAQGEWRWDLTELTASKLHQLQLRRVVDVVKPLFLWHGHFHVSYATDVGFDPAFETRVRGLNCDETTKSDNIEVVDLLMMQENLGKRGLL